MVNQPKVSISDEEAALLHVLQLSPRISWARAANILDTHPARVSALWHELTASRLSWVTCYAIADLTIALIDLELSDALKAPAIAALSLMSSVVSIEETAGQSNLRLTVMTQSLATMKTFLLDKLPGIIGASPARTRLATAVHRHGGNWHFDALTPAQSEKTLRTAPPAPPTQRRTARFAPQLKPIIEALMVDGRTTAAQLAQRLDRPETTVRRQIGEVLSSGSFAMRTEVAQLTTRWPVAATWFANISPRHLSETVAAIHTLSETRLCLSLAGPSNFTLSVWAESLADVLDIEVMLSTKLPHLDIHESSITLRVFKRMGWLIDDEGRSTGEYIPTDTVNYF